MSLDPDGTEIPSLAQYTLRLRRVWLRAWLAVGTLRAILAELAWHAIEAHSRHGWIIDRLARRARRTDLPVCRDVLRTMNSTRLAVGQVRKRLSAWGA
eukprot:COSAG04_NODE_26613_length_293_cov_0.360825_1_plen_97_part_11